MVLLMGPASEAIGASRVRMLEGLGWGGPPARCDVVTGRRGVAEPYIAHRSSSECSLRPFTLDPYL